MPTTHVQTTLLAERGRGISEEHLRGLRRCRITQRASCHRQARVVLLIRWYPFDGMGWDGMEHSRVGKVSRRDGQEHQARKETNHIRPFPSVMWL